MKTKIIFFSLLFGTLLSAQYQPMAVEGRQWNEYFYYQFSPGETRYFHFVSDSLYKGELLPRLEERDTLNGVINAYTHYYLKEDSVTNTLTFYYPPNTWRGDSFVLNLDIKVGDTVHYPLPTFLDTSAYYHLDSIRIFTDNQNTPRNQYFFSFNIDSGCSHQGNHLSWIAGLGSPERGMSKTFPIYPCLSDGPPVGQLLCVGDSSGNTIYQNPRYSYCHKLFSLAENQFLEFQIFPNPSSRNFYLEWRGDVLEISVENSLGKEILSQSCESGWELNLGNQPAGVYVVRVFEKGKFLGARKIVKN